MILYKVVIKMNKGEGIVLQLGSSCFISSLRDFGLLLFLFSTCIKSLRDLDNLNGCFSTDIKSRWD